MPEPAAEKPPTPVAPPHQAAVRIPDHELIRCIGRGSYGEIWLARNVIGTYRAVKVVYRSTFEKSHPYEREFNGIKKFEPVSRSHDGFVDILQVGRNDEAGYFYYVMELADDRATAQDIHPERYMPKTLDGELCRRKRLPFAESLQVGLSLSSALGHLHSHGLVHRDVKPANVIFVRGMPKLADIGLVTELDANTMPGGTVGYIPPEGTLGPQGDIFALGKVLYEVSTGRDRQEFPEWPTFDGDAQAETKFSEMNEVVIRACAHDPRDRYQTADELYDDLLLLQSGKSVKRLRVLERRWKMLARVALVLAAAILLSGTGTYLAYRAKNATIRRLAESYVAYGTHSIDEGDLFGSLPWFAEALRLDQGDAEREDRDRIHLALTLRQCPKTVRLWFYARETDYARFSPDGRRVIVGGSDGTAAVWDVTNDTPVLKLSGHAKEVMSVAYSRDGQFLLTASLDRTACVWQATNGQRLATLSHPAALYHAQFSPDGTRVVTASTDSRARVWDWAQGRELLVFAKHAGPIRSAAFSPDGQRILTASHDKTARIWDASTGESLGKPFRHDNWLYQAAFSPDGRFVVTASFDQTAALWEVETGRQIRAWPHQAAVRGAEFSPDGRLIVTTSWDLTTRLWDVATGQQIGPPLKHDSQALSISFSPDGRRLVAASTRGIVTLWDLAPIRWSPPRIEAFFSGDGSYLATVNGNTVQLQGAASTNSVKLEFAHAVSEVKINRNGSRLLTISSVLSSPAGPVAYAQLWDGMPGRPLAPAFACDPPFALAAMSDSGLRLVTVTGAVAQVWDTMAGQRLARLQIDGRIRELSFDPSGSLLVFCHGKRAEIWNVAKPARCTSSTMTAT
jgi:WD40 repeat protein